MAINDRAWIYGLISAGYTKKEISKIRSYDLKIQGLNNKVKKLIKQIYKNAVEIVPDIFICDIPFDINLSYLRDLIALRDTNKIISSLLLRRAANNKIVHTVFTGSPKIVKKLYKTFGGSLAGDERYSMVWTSAENISKQVIKFLKKI